MSWIIDYNLQALKCDYRIFLYSPWCYLYCILDLPQAALTCVYRQGCRSWTKQKPWLMIWRGGLQSRVHCWKLNNRRQMLPCRKLPPPCRCALLYLLLVCRCMFVTVSKRQDCPSAGCHISSNFPLVYYTQNFLHIPPCSIFPAVKTLFSVWAHINICLFCDFSASAFYLLIPLFQFPFTQSALRTNKM